MPYFVPDVAVKVAARSVNLFGMGVGVSGREHN